MKIKELFLIEQILPVSVSEILNADELNQVYQSYDPAYRDYPITDFETANDEYQELRRTLRIPLQIFRALDVRRFEDIESPLGQYWSWKKEGADTHGVTHAVVHDPLVITTSINNLASVDWKQTVLMNLIYPYEYEITLKPGTRVQVNGKTFTI